MAQGQDGGADELVRYEVRDGVAMLTLNRPERLNAWTEALSACFYERLRDANDDLDVRVILLTGAGRAFCAGGDMDLLREFADNPSREATYPVTPSQLRFGKPVVAAINGACAGIGLVQALLADVRFASTEARFTTAYVRRGLVAELGLSWLLPRIVGAGPAADLLLSGRVFGGDEAHRWGMVTHLSAPDELMDDAMAYARVLASECSPYSMAAIKNQLYSHLVVGFDDALAETIDMMTESYANRDFSEGVASFVEKRPPAFAPLATGHRARTGTATGTGAAQEPARRSASIEHGR